MKTYKKIIFSLIFTLGLLLIPRVSFASPSFDTITFNNDTIYLPEYINNYSNYSDEDIFISYENWGSYKYNIIFNRSLISNNNNLTWVNGSIVWLVYDNTSSRKIKVNTYNSPFNLLSGSSNIYWYWYYTDLNWSNYQGSIIDFTGIDIPNYLHILGNFNNASCNISNGSVINENIVVTADENYYFTNVQTGFVLSDNDTLAMYDGTGLTGDFNLVASDFVTALIGSDDPPVDPPVDPPTDEPVIIGDFTFLSSLPIANEFKGLFLSTNEIWRKLVPISIGIFGLSFACCFIFKFITKI